MLLLFYCKPCKLLFRLPIVEIIVIIVNKMCKGDMLENMESRFVQCSATSQQLRLTE